MRRWLLLVAAAALGCANGLRPRVAARSSLRAAQRRLPSLFAEQEPSSVVPPPKKSLLKEYGWKYLATWFTVYLPFLCSFFFLIETGRLPVDAERTAEVVEHASVWLQSAGLGGAATGFAATIRQPQGAHLLNFAAAYLAADLVPTTVIALALLGLSKAGAKTSDAAGNETI